MDAAADAMGRFMRGSFGLSDGCGSLIGLATLDGRGSSRCALHPSGSHLLPAIRTVFKAGLACL